MISDEDGNSHSAKNSNLSMKMLNKVRIGRLYCIKTCVPYGLAISMFGRYGEDEFVFRENEIVLETGASVYIHVMSASRIESIFTLDKFCLTSHYCVKKSCHHRLCGKVFLINSTTRRHSVGYILNESFDGRRLLVLHHVTGSLMTFPRPE